MKKQYVYVANFKSYLTFTQEVKWYKDNIKELKILAKDNQVIICPSSISLSSYNEIRLGAQNCSSFGIGPYTGEISSQSLENLGVQYCLVGHSERRQYFGETLEVITKKIEELLKNNITPILCVGETQKEYKTGITEDVLRKQLGILKFDAQVIIAYEPIWAIGSGVIPDIEYIKKIYNFINNLMDKKYKILYGGSVNQDLVQKLKQFTNIDGFLIGKSSTSFQEFKKIVLS